ncbi:porin [Pseudoalteromonas sp. MMG005]|uniref:outer membrane protein n=1 Tax=Pseudoalteromonas sp. MMG005 TaxID=2822682 RepID=UPI001B3A3701|nr:porin [Pseudoalteromonas sp. MMG005]MBQ4845224.1 porin family protein [Pseudoalteromonas sp. MMG005]
MKTFLPLACALFCASSFANSEPSYFINLTAGHSSFAGDNAVQRGTNQGNTPVNGYDVDSGGLYGLGVGYRFGNGFALQLEWRTREYETDSTPQPANPAGGLADQTFQVLGKNETDTIMLNAYYEFDMAAENFKPYIKAGVGTAKHDVNAELDIQPWFQTLDFSTLTACPDNPLFCYPSNDSSEFAWSIGAGFNYQLTENVSVGLDYQYIDFKDSQTNLDPLGDQAVFPDLKAHEFSATLTYTF